jgi:hypothetical protein
VASPQVFSSVESEKHKLEIELKTASINSNLLSLQRELGQYGHLANRECEPARIKGIEETALVTVC